MTSEPNDTVYTRRAHDLRDGCRPAARIIGHGQFLRIRPDDETDAEAAAAMAALDDAGVDVADVEAFFVDHARSAHGDERVAVDSLGAMDAAVALLERGGASVVIVATAIHAGDPSATKPRAATALVMTSTHAPAPRNRRGPSRCEAVLSDAAELPPSSS